MVISIKVKPIFCSFVETWSGWCVFLEFLVFFFRKETNREKTWYVKSDRKKRCWMEDRKSGVCSQINIYMGLRSTILSVDQTRWAAIWCYYWRVFGFCAFFFLFRNQQKKTTKSESDLSYLRTEYTRDKAVISLCIICFVFYSKIFVLLSTSFHRSKLSINWSSFFTPHFVFAFIFNLYMHGWYIYHLFYFIFSVFFAQYSQ